MKILNLTLWLCLTFIVSTIQVEPVSTCLQNCLSCSPTAPQSCIPLPDEQQIKCIPYSSGNDCKTHDSPFKIFSTQKGNFNDWTPSVAQRCSRIDLTGSSTSVSNQTFSTLKPNQVSQDLEKTFYLPNGIQATSCLLNMIFFINDTRLTPENNQTSISFNVLQVEVNNDKSFLRFKSLSSVQTNCGRAYNFQLKIPIQRNINQLKIKISPNTQTNSWRLYSFELSIGCSLYTSSFNGLCNQCLTGFYPVLQYLQNGDNLVKKCQFCNFRCKTCSSATQCLSCQNHMTFNQATKMCEYTNDSFRQITNFTINTGKAEVSNASSEPYISDVNSEITIQRILPTNSPYWAKFQIFYTRQFQQFNPTLEVYLNQVSNQNITLSFQASSIFQENNSNKTRVFFKKIIIDTLHLESVNKTFNMTIKAKVNRGRFYMLSDYFILLQFKCFKNCRSCKFEDRDKKICNKCDNFFATPNCKTCSNGYFLRKITQNESICGKCHSSCYQCKQSGATNCKSCYFGFQPGNIEYDFQCIECFYNLYKGNNICKKQQCLQKNSFVDVLKDINCKQCLSQNDFNQLTSTISCRLCWIDKNLASSQCIPVNTVSISGYSFYGSDISHGVVDQSKWQGSAPLVKFDCSTYSESLYGIPNDPNSNQLSKLTLKQSFLPAHRGLILIMTIVKVDDWLQKTTNTINITVRSPQQQLKSKPLVVDNTGGANVCGESGSEMFFNYVGYFQEHTSTDQLSLEIQGSSDGLFVKQVQLYLANCPQCSDNRLNTQVEFLPKYSVKITEQTGIYIYLFFSKPIINTNNLSINQLLISFRFTIDKLGDSKYLIYTEVINNIQLQNMVRYFIPLNQSFINGTINVNSTLQDQIFSLKNTRRLQQVQDSAQKIKQKSPRLLFNDRLSSDPNNRQIDRYTAVQTDNRISMNQLYTFFFAITWIILIAMIISTLLGVSIIFEQFSLLLQLLFLHVYISSHLLPASFKAPMSGLQRMQNLNYFISPLHQQNILFYNVVMPSPYIFTQYNQDIYFARTMYSCIFINLIYLGWFLIWFIIEKAITPFRDSKRKLVKFFRNIPNRPLNYFDQIWRYQFVTVIWGCFLQFYYFQGANHIEKLVLAICIISFIVVIVWPIFVVIYTYAKHFNVNVRHFLYSYEDIFYLKISSIADKIRYYLYIWVRYLRFFFYTLFIAQFYKHEVIAPIILFITSLFELVYVLRLKVFRNKVYLAFKVIENILFMILQIIFLVVYAISDIVSQQNYLNLGYGITILYAILIVNAGIRTCYITYLKIQNFLEDEYDIGDQGVKQEYENNDYILKNIRQK